MLGVHVVATLMALSLLVESGYWWTIQLIAFGMVWFTLFVQAPAVMMRVLKLGRK